MRLVKQPKKAGTSRVVFLIELLGFPGGKEEEERRGWGVGGRKKEHFRPNQSNQTYQFKTLELEWCLQYTLFAVMLQGSLSNQLVYMQLK